jgi:hypothetical protein
MSLIDFLGGEGPVLNRPSSPAPPLWHLAWAELPMPRAAFQLPQQTSDEENKIPQAHH